MSIFSQPREVDQSPTRLDFIQILGLKFVALDDAGERALFPVAAANRPIPEGVFPKN
jgi:hypothetical protein